MPVQRRNLVRALERAGIDLSANAPRTQEQIFLSYRLDDLTFLIPPIACPHGSVTNLQAAVAPNVHACLRITPGGLGMRVLNIACAPNSWGPVTFIVAPAGGGSWLATLYRNEWGGEVPEGVGERCTVPAYTYGSIGRLAPGEFMSRSDIEIDVLPGEALYILDYPSNTGMVAGVAWVEPTRGE